GRPRRDEEPHAQGGGGRSDVLSARGADAPGAGHQALGRLPGTGGGAFVAVLTQTVTDQYALYLGDCCEVLPTLPDASIHLSVYSPPFAGLYHYSSNERDLS